MTQGSVFSAEQWRVNTKRIQTSIPCVLCLWWCNISTHSHLFSANVWESGRDNWKSLVQPIQRQICPPGSRVGFACRWKRIFQPTLIVVVVVISLSPFANSALALLPSRLMWFDERRTNCSSLSFCTRLRFSHWRTKNGPAERRATVITLHTIQTKPHQLLDLCLGCFLSHCDPGGVN